MIMNHFSLIKIKLAKKIHYFVFLSHFTRLDHLDLEL